MVQPDEPESQDIMDMINQAEKKAYEDQVQPQPQQWRNSDEVIDSKNNMEENPYLLDLFPNTQN